MSRSRDFSLDVNAVRHTLTLPEDVPLLYVLRNDLALNGPKFGCGIGECGACTVLIDGMAARSCAMPVSVAVGRKVVTLEGLGNRDNPDPVQQAFIEEQAAQCGYCLNGMIIVVKALLLRNPDPTEAQIRAELEFNLCRCGTHVEIMRAARRAVELNKAANAAMTATAAMAAKLAGARATPHE